MSNSKRQWYDSVKENVRILSLLEKKSFLSGKSEERNDYLVAVLEGFYKPDIHDC